MRYYDCIKKHITSQRILFFSILLFAFFIRLYKLDSLPPGINQDEAMGAVDAWALSEYGTDRYGMRWPVHFTAWKYGQMSVLMSYCMIPFIKILGFTTLAVRLPIALISSLCVAVMYGISRKLFSEKLSLAVMAFAAINPWQFMQSRWALDCNLFPHMFLIGFYLLLCGLEKRRCLYLSMVFFGLTFYCYGVAVYTVPVFLVLFAAWCLWQKEFAWKEILLSALVFFMVALPEILTMFINMFKLPSIETPLFTIPYFPESMRSNDILFLNFSWHQLGRNALSMWKQAFLQKQDYIYNALPQFGPLYRFSTPFLLLGIISFFIHTFAEKDSRKKTLRMSLCSFFVMGIWTGLMTFEVNINRINIIFYSLIFLTVYGFYCLGRTLTRCAAGVYGVVVMIYMILAAAFLNHYFTTIGSSLHTMFNVDFLCIMKDADQMEEYDTLYVTSHMGWQMNYRMSEILAHYACRIDSRYYQGLTNETGDRELLSYNERYHFTDIAWLQSFDTEALYVLHKSDLQYIKSEYDIVTEEGEFLAIDLR